MLKKLLLFLTSLIVIICMVTIPFQINYENTHHAIVFPKEVRTLFFLTVLVFSLVVIYHRFWDPVRYVMKEKIHPAIPIWILVNVGGIFATYDPTNTGFIIFIIAYAVVNVILHITSQIKMN